MKLIMKKSIHLCFLCFSILIVTAISAAAKPATLTWDQSSEPVIVGYKIYYRTNTPSFPFNGTNLSEGASPIVVDGVNSTSLRVDLPDDGNIYYFTATSVSNTGLESMFSDIVASEWVPHLLTPTNNASTSNVATFAWDPHPAGDHLTFDLYYGTDPNFDSNTMAFTSPGTFRSNWPPFELNITITLAILLSLLMAIISTKRRANPLWNPIRMGLCIGVFILQASCGGSGGVDDLGDSIDTTVPGTEAPTPSTLFTDVVTDIETTQYQVTLQPNTQYYWKVVAVDNWGKTYESIPQKFTTL